MQLIKQNLNIFFTICLNRPKYGKLVKFSCSFLWDKRQTYQVNEKTLMTFLSQKNAFTGLWKLLCPTESIFSCGVHWKKVKFPHHKNLYFFNVNKEIAASILILRYETVEMFSA